MKIKSLLNYKVFTTIIFILLALLIYGGLYHNVKPETYDVELFSVAEKTIRSPKTVEDEAKTEEERKRAVNEVEKVYVFKKEIAQNRISLVTSIFDFVLDMQEDAKRSTPNDSADASEKQATPLTHEEKLELLKETLTKNVSEDVTKAIPDQIFSTLLKASNADLTKAKKEVGKQVEGTMEEKIREDQVSKIKEDIAAKIGNSSISDNLKDAAIALAQYAIVANDIYDPQLTEEQKSYAKENVESVKILQGQVIVQEGHLIDRETYRQLELLGLLKSNPTVKPYIGLVIFVFMIIGTLYLYFYNMKAPEEKKQNYIFLTSIILIIALVLMNIIGFMRDLQLNNIGYIFPAAMAPMLIRIMMNERFALIITIILSACGSIIFHDHITGTINFEIAIYILFSGLAGVMFLSNRNQRPNILQAGLCAAVVNIMLIFFILFIGGGQFTRIDYLYNVIYAVVSGLSSAVLTMGLLPFFEAGFGLLSTMKLIELSNPNHPLLKKILTEAPGTYHHSVMVANLSEAACEAIGANGLLARVGCYYHDLGKTKRPHYFIENQMNINNPHDDLSPETSRDIIVAHVTDGAHMLKKNKFPKEIVDIAEQHHGTTLLKYFYYKAKKEDEDVLEEEFRYPGPKPQTKEAAVVSIADSVEAAVRSMSHPTPDQIKSLVQNIIQDRLQDEQLNECDITLKELEIIKNIFCETLNGIFHSRIEYPDFKKQKVKKHAIND